MQGDVLIDMLEDRPVAYHPKLAKCVGGVKAAIMLCQLLYWAAGKTAKSRDGWFYKSVAEMEEETGLSKDEQQTARDKLDDLGVIDSKLKGIPRTWHYRVNRERLRQVIVERFSHWTETPANDGGELPPILDDVSAQLNKNQETTQEITHIAAQAPRRTAATKRGDPLDGMLAYAGKGDKFAAYPPNIQDILRPVCDLWKLEPPAKIGKRGGEYARWIADALELRDACGNLPLADVLEQAHRDWEKQSFFVSGPGSLLKAARAAAAKVRRRNVAPEEIYNEVYR